MKRHIGFGSIGQLRQAITTVSQRARYTGKDENDEPIYDKHIKLPTLTFTASEKIHGSNASVCFSNADGFWVQSRENIITLEKDNFGCAAWCEGNKDAWMNLIDIFATEYNVDLDNNIISIFFEWCGGGIQKKSAVSSLDKRAIMFQHFKVSPLVRTETPDPNAPDPNAYWLETALNTDKTAGPNGEAIHFADNEANIFNIMLFPHYEFEIDFEQPKMCQNKMVEQVIEIETNSPVGKKFGVDGNVGEGVVCTAMFKDKLIRFKIKGEKHSASKVKTLKPVDEAKEQIKIDFVNEFACTASRLEQAWDKTFAVGATDEIKPVVEKTGDFLRNVITDVMKEESDIMEERGIDKSINGTISKVARGWFMEQLDKEAGL